MTSLALAACGACSNPISRGLVLRTAAAVVAPHVESFGSVSSFQMVYVQQLSCVYHPITALRIAGTNIHQLPPSLAPRTCFNNQLAVNSAVGMCEHLNV